MPNDWGKMVATTGGGVDVRRAAIAYGQGPRQRQQAALRRAKSKIQSILDELVSQIEQEDHDDHSTGFGDGDQEPLEESAGLKAAKSRWAELRKRYNPKSPLRVLSRVKDAPRGHWHYDADGNVIKGTTEPSDDGPDWRSQSRSARRVRRTATREKILGVGLHVT